MQKRQRLVIALPVALLLLSGYDARGQAVRKHRSLDITEVQKQNYEAAIDAFRHATDYCGMAQQGKGEADILGYLAEAEYHAGKYGGALTRYKLLLRKDSRKTAYLDLACVVTVKADRGWDTALVYCEEARKAGRDRTLRLEAFYLLGGTA